MEAIRDTQRLIDVFQTEYLDTLHEYSQARSIAEQLPDLQDALTSFHGNEEQIAELEQMIRDLREEITQVHLSIEAETKLRLQLTAERDPIAANLSQVQQAITALENLLKIPEEHIGQVRQFSGNANTVRSVAYAPDGKKPRSPREPMARSASLMPRPHRSSKN